MVKDKDDVILNLINIIDKIKENSELQNKQINNLIERNEILETMIKDNQKSILRCHKNHLSHLERSALSRW